MKIRTSMTRIKIITISCFIAFILLICPGFVRSFSLILDVWISSLFYWSQPLVKTMHFSARALVMRKNLIKLADGSTWMSYGITPYGSHSMDNKVSVSCING